MFSSNRLYHRMATSSQAMAECSGIGDSSFLSLVSSFALPTWESDECILRNLFSFHSLHLCSIHDPSFPYTPSTKNLASIQIQNQSTRHYLPQLTAKGISLTITTTPNQSSSPTQPPSPENGSRRRPRHRLHPLPLLSQKLRGPHGSRLRISQSTWTPGWGRLYAAGADDGLSRRRSEKGRGGRWGI